MTRHELLRMAFNILLMVASLMGAGTVPDGQRSRNRVGPHGRCYSIFDGYSNGR